MSEDSPTLASDQKRLLLEHLLQDPRRPWLHYLDGRQALRMGILLHLGRLRPTGKSDQRV